MSMRLALGLALIWSLARPARATQCQAIAGGQPRLAAIDAEERLRWLDRQLARSARYATMWSVGWGATYGAITVIQLGMLPIAKDEGDVAERVVAAAKAAIGTVSFIVFPLTVIADQRWWARRRAHAPPDTDPCALLAQGERLLLRGAKSEAFGVSPLTHAGNFAINIAGSLVLGIAYGRWTTAAWTMVFGIAVGEIEIASQPQDMVLALEEYRAGNLAPSRRAARPRWALSPSVSRDLVMMDLTLRY